MPGAPKIPKGGAQPLDFDPIGNADDLMRDLALHGLSARDDVPNVTDATGQRSYPASTITSLRMPARVDPQLIADATDQLAKAEALRGAASFVPATVFGVKHGRTAGPLPGNGGPIWDAVRQQITAPLQRAQLDTQQVNDASDVLNKVAMMNQGAGSQDRATAMALAGQRGTAQVAAADRAMQQKQFEESQETARRGQDLTLQGAQARLAGPQAEKLHQLRALNQSALDNLDELEGKIRSGSASPASGTIFGRRVGTNAGVDTANTIGMLANNLSQVGEKRGLRGPMQDEIANELNSGVQSPAAGLKIISKWRKYVQDFNDELNSGMHTGAASPSAAPAARAAPAVTTPFDPDADAAEFGGR